ncbi:MAG: hypothetical protein CVV23_13050 [Ignavibacteriae bacterium HGW-Ignavibacteriae-2]|nr:MAG: hypothetical protein CVV23_13050 [Ignavibacteriae bacterium HGW-Ignavibacteriae-2]
MKILIRPWTKADFKSFRLILRDSWRDAYSEFFPVKDQTTYLNEVYNDLELEKMFIDNSTQVFIVSVEEKPCALLRLSQSADKTKFYINSLYVHPEFNGLGIGKQLISFAEEQCLSFGYKEVWLGVIKKNERALNWYIKLGFKFLQEEPFRMGDTVVRHLIGFKSLKSSL